MRMRWASSAILLVTGALLLAGVLAGCGGTPGAAGSFSARTKGVLTVATSDVPEAGFWEGTAAHPTGGFEYAFAEALAQRLGLRMVRVVVVPFDRLANGDLGGADLALSLLTPTSAREQHLTFSTPYIDSAPTAVVRAGQQIPDLQTAQGLRWGAERGTTFVSSIADEIQPTTPVRTYADDAELSAALLSGQVDAAVHDLPLAVAVANASGGKLAVAAKLPQPEAIAAALPLGSDNVQALDSAIRSLDADGTTHGLLARWVGAAAADSDQVPLLQTTL